ncbi:unnamed protein product [Bursaphelenchus okinawaensis]|uniref:Molybdopterin synthase sulfur carrier subunit n=1 Tax=Bursaphelenchus okinawaensis TaxID=465554 RepID=A0A811JSL1_9BILA|nr:unnamed protein product [Bursaphelenchus okinawaensis]CAG9081758.1 unnamed protein product [Bursaphelenchus okinawaensis]
MPVKVLLFGKAAELAGKKETFLEVHGEIRYETLLSNVFDSLPELNTIRENCVIAVDQKYGSTNEWFHIKDNTEIAIIPPLSGG